MFIHICTLFFSGKTAEASALRRYEIPHCFQQSQIVFLAPYQDGTKQGQRGHHATWSLVGLWATFPWAGLALPIFPGTFWTHGRTTVSEISLFVEVARHSGFYEFHSCALCRQVLCISGTLETRMLRCLHRSFLRLSPPRSPTLFDRTS